MTIARPLFHPAFGSRPQEIIGRDQVIVDFLLGLQEPIGSQRRCTFFLGQRGVGKTALLLELADRAVELDYVVARVTAYEGMPQEIVETIQHNGSQFFKKEPHKKIQGFEAGALGFSFGLSFDAETDSQYGFRTKLSLLCDRLNEQGKGVLLLIDEAHSSESMRQVATAYQHLVGEDKNIAMAMAGLPHALSSVLNDKVLTFLNRARKVTLGSISLVEVRRYYRRAFDELDIACSDELLDRAASITEGFPYLVQLVGYYLTQYAHDKSIDENALSKAIRDSFDDLESNVFQPILAPLSDNDMAFLLAMAQDSEITKSSDLQRRLSVGNSFVQPYRARLIDAGIIEAPRKGELVFAVPHLADYLRRQSEND